MAKKVKTVLFIVSLAVLIMIFFFWKEKNVMNNYDWFIALKKDSIKKVMVEGFSINSDLPKQKEIASKEVFIQTLYKSIESGFNKFIPKSTLEYAYQYDISLISSSSNLSLRYVFNLSEGVLEFKDKESQRSGTIILKKEQALAIDTLLKNNLDD